MKYLKKYNETYKRINLSFEDGEIDDNRKESEFTIIEIDSIKNKFNNRRKGITTEIMPDRYYIYVNSYWIGSKFSGNTKIEIKNGIIICKIFKRED